MDRLDAYLTYHILSYLDIRDCISLSFTSRQFNIDLDPVIREKGLTYTLANNLYKKIELFKKKLTIDHVILAIEHNHCHCFNKIVELEGTIDLYHVLNIFVKRFMDSDSKRYELAPLIALIQKRNMATNYQIVELLAYLFYNCLCYQCCYCELFLNYKQGGFRFNKIFNKQILEYIGAVLFIIMLYAIRKF